MEDWIKDGNKCYVHSAMGWMNSGCMTIKKVGRKYFYLKNEPRVRIVYILCVVHVLDMALYAKSIPRKRLLIAYRNYYVKGKFLHKVCTS